jgi:hypothetical protein
MTDSQLHLTRPTSKQLVYLTDLALKAGQSFAYPRTRAQASAEIKRLNAARRASAAERRRETRELRRDFAEGRGDASSVRDDELVGYGSRATWS